MTLDGIKSEQNIRWGISTFTLEIPQANYQAGRNVVEYMVNPLGSSLLLLLTKSILTRVREYLPLLSKGITMIVNHIGDENGKTF